MKNKILGIVILLVLFGCANNPNAPDYPISQSKVKAQTFTYTDLDGDKEELWEKARNYIATVYGDSKAVLRVEDEKNGTLIGKGLIGWKIFSSALSPTCHSEYDIRFVAKDNKARLQLELLSGAPALSGCTWKLPSNFGYEQVISEFERMSSELESALRGSGKIEKMQDF